MYSCCGVIGRACVHVLERYNQLSHRQWQAWQPDSCVVPAPRAMPAAAGAQGPGLPWGCRVCSADDAHTVPQGGGTPVYVARGDPYPGEHGHTRLHAHNRGAVGAGPRPAHVLSLLLSRATRPLLCTTTIALSCPHDQSTPLPPPHPHPSLSGISLVMSSPTPAARSIPLNRTAPANTSGSCPGSRPSSR